MDDQRDYQEEAANRAAMEQEGRAEYAAEQRTKPLAVRLAEFCEVDQARFLSLIHDAYDVAAVTHANTLTRGQLLNMLAVVLTSAEVGSNAYGSAPYELHPLVTS